MKRRDFIKRLGVAASLPAIIPASAWSSHPNNSPNDRITLGFIGVGKQGGGLLWGFLNTPGSQVVAVCDVDKKKLQRAQDRANRFYANRNAVENYNGVEAYTDFREIIHRKDIDAVVIATPDHWHAITSIMAARAGKDIYCEKPLTLTLSEGRLIEREVRRHGRVFQTGSMQRSSSQFRQAAELVQNGYIGDIQHVRVSIRTGFIPHPIDCDLPSELKLPELDWDMWLGQAPERPYHSIIAPPISFNGFPAWRNYREYSGGGMADWGAHHFDIAQWALGMDKSGPVKVYPVDDKDVKELTYFYANGIEMVTDFENNRILFTGTEGWIEVNRSYIKASSDRLLSLKLKSSDIHLYDSNNHKLDWFQAIRKRTRPITDVEIGHRSCSVCHLGNLAAQLDRPLTWNPDAEEFIDDDEANRLRSRPQRSPWRLT